MEDKFADVPIDTDTKITGQKIIELDGVTALHQKWRWEGIKAESLIFASSDVIDLTDQALEQITLASGLVNAGSQMTMKRSDNGFVFVNFNFRD